MKLHIVTPQAAELSVETGKVFLPGALGAFEILDGHAPLIAALGEGEVSWEGAAQPIKIASGVVEVKNDVVTVAAQQR